MRQRVLIGGQRVAVDDETGAIAVEPAGGVPVSAGVAAKATSDDTAVELIAASASRVYRTVTVANTGAVAGFVSLDGGTTWLYLPAQWVREFSGVTIDNKAIQLKRIAGGDNVTGVYADAW